MPEESSSAPALPTREELERFAKEAADRRAERERAYAVRAGAELQRQYKQINDKADNGQKG